MTNSKAETSSPLREGRGEVSRSPWNVLKKVINPVDPDLWAEIRDEANLIQDVEDQTDFLLSLYLWAAFGRQLRCQNTALNVTVSRFAERIGKLKIKS